MGTEEVDLHAEYIKQQYEEEEKYFTESDFKQEEYDLQMQLELLVTRIDDIDEFEYFTNNFRRAQQ